MDTTKLKMIPCPKCGEDFPELRKTQYGYNHCVNCSTVEKKVGVTTIEGIGDHTWNDLIIMDASTARNIAAKEAEIAGNKKALLELIDMDVDDMAVSQSIKEAVDNQLSDDNEYDFE